MNLWTLLAIVVIAGAGFAYLERESDNKVRLAEVTSQEACKKQLPGEVQLWINDNNQGLWDSLQDKPFEDKLKTLCVNNIKSYNGVTEIHNPACAWLVGQAVALTSRFNHCSLSRVNETPLLTCKNDEGVAFNPF